MQILSKAYPPQLLEDNVVLVGNLTCSGIVQAAGMQSEVVAVNELRGIGTLIELVDNVVIHGSLVVNGTITAYDSNPFWVAMKVSAAGGVLSNTGRYTATIVRNATLANFDFTFPEHPRGANAIIMVQGFEFSSFLRGQSSTGVRVYIRDMTNTSILTNAEFSILVLA